MKAKRSPRFIYEIWRLLRVSLILFLFITVINFLTEDLNDSLMELLYTDGYALLEESLDDDMGKCKIWKRVLEERIVRLNVEFSYCMVREIMIRRWIFVVYVVNRLIVTLFKMYEMSELGVPVLFRCAYMNQIALSGSLCL